MNILGIDPGRNGALALLCPDLPPPVRVMSMPEDDSQKFDQIQYWSTAGPMVAYIEQQWGRPGQSGVKVLTHFGMLLGFLTALGVRTEVVSPQKWKRAVGLVVPKPRQKKLTWDEPRPTLAEQQVAEKERRKAYQLAKTSSRLLAAMKFPTLADRFEPVKSDGLAEALLIAAYGMEIENAAH